MQDDRNRMQADGLDRLVDRHLRARNGESAGGHDVGDVARRNRTVELAAIAGLAQQYEGLAFQLLADLRRFLAMFEIARFQLRALSLEISEIGLCRAQR